MKPLLLLLLLFFPIHSQEYIPSEDVPWAAAEITEAPTWGWHTLIDLHDCDHDLITNAEHIKAYVHVLCNLIDMKKFGECHVVNFGENEEVAGYSMFQLIETSNISGHFVNKTNRAFIDIFSCKEYSPEAALEFTAQMFSAKNYEFRIIKRK